MGYRVGTMLFIHPSSRKGHSANFALKLSEKGYEQCSERRFGRCSGAKTGRMVPFGWLLRLSFGYLRDFSDSFLTEFSEVRQEVCSDAACSDDAHRREVSWIWTRWRRCLLPTSSATLRCFPA